MEYRIVGFPAAEPTLDLSHEEFAYAGNFVMTSTGKSVAREDGTVVAATAFNADHDDPDTERIRYVTVRENRRGEGIGPRLLRFTAEQLSDRRPRVTIAVNNPIAYEACYRAGFVSTGEETGIAELELVYDPDGQRSGSQYRQGFDVFAGRDLPPDQQSVLSRHQDGSPPSVVPVPDGEE